MMNHTFKKGDQKTHYFIVEKGDVATFGGNVVHKVCSTFALAREIEWSSRLFVLEMKEADEEGIGTMLAIDHRSPTLLGDEVHILASVSSISGNELICEVKAVVNDRIVATGKTGQKILKKDKIKRLFAAVNSHGKERE